MQILLSMDTDQRTELENMIHDLEEENKSLQVEYDRLKQAHRQTDAADTVHSRWVCLSEFEESEFFFSWSLDI